MMHATPAPHRQSGSVLVVLTLSLTVLLGVAGLAIDLGHAYVNKTRLQSAVDSVALSAAISLNRFNDTTTATADGLQTFNSLANEDGNGELRVLSDADFTFEYSDKLDPFIPGGANPQFVRVIVGSLALRSWLIQVFGVDDKAVAATAVSGPIPLQEICDVAPLVACAEVDPISGEALDTNCEDGACFGYDTQQEMVLKTGAGSGQGGTWDIGPGNYRLARVGASQGGDDIRHNMAGAYENCLDDADDIPTEPGNTVGPTAQGLNTRFGMYAGGMGRYADIYRPDYVTSILASGTPPSADPIFPDYTQAYQNSVFDHLDGEPERRMLALPFVDCSTSVNGTGTLSIVGMGCFLLTRPAVQGGDQEIYGELIRVCPARGRPDPNSVAGPGPFKIILYKNPQGRDA